jgi:hemerythrin-like domain-containing protein
MIRLEQITDKPEMGAKATLDRPLDHLVACHRRIEERLEILERAAAHLGDRRDEAMEAIENCFRFLDSNGMLHTADEEESIFPRLQGRLNQTDAEFLRNLEAEHREADGLYERLKELLAGLAAAGPGTSEGLIEDFADVVRRLCEIYRRHIAAEDAHLIGIARAGLNESQLCEISREMKIRRGLNS